MQTKQCSKCGQVLPLTEFHLDSKGRDGRVSWCKTCKHTYNRVRNQTAEYKAHNEARKQTAEYKAYMKTYLKKYNQRPEVKADASRRQKLDLAKYPERFKARRAVNSAVRDRKLERLPCVQCGNPKSEGHHEDYTHPLLVKWLCRPCHREHHSKQKEIV